ncbi:hypothetical protein GBZ48_19215 [Azospirillum melinis]|uniref:Glycosyltransferase family 9 protein n=1 Tax=Azospirillum melinis TaxID=328839 RepID=A0ABX2KFB3_9PROT|nr:hypothetical protein [Azospirillum melinis]MBP2307293.1 hypothetical protein [Azospirillum melinis]NUB01393.1 hypothetical protein [Azospirillum melinis]
MTERILLGQLGSNGDCLYATAVARQIKLDHPKAHLTWGIADLTRDSVRHLPYVDEWWEFPVRDFAEMEHAWHRFEREAWARHGAGEFTRLVMTQIWPGNMRHFDGTVRPSLYRGYPSRITDPAIAHIHLTDEEREEVNAWVADMVAPRGSRVCLVECFAKSGQSFMTPALAQSVAERVTAAVPDCVVILSTHLPIANDNPRILWGGHLSIRQTAHLTNYIDLFMGCGSGLTVAATSSAAKIGIPLIQVLESSASVFGSFRHDFDYWGCSSDNFLETTSSDANILSRIIVTTLYDGLVAAKAAFDQPQSLQFSWYRHLITEILLRRSRFVEAAQSWLLTIDRYGPMAELRDFAISEILPHLAKDPLSDCAHRQAQLLRFHNLCGYQS